MCLQRNAAFRRVPEAGRSANKKMNQRFPKPFWLIVLPILGEAIWFFLLTFHDPFNKAQFSLGDFLLLWPAVLLCKYGLSACVFGGVLTYIWVPSFIFLIALRHFRRSELRPD